ncbi:MAG TPA: enoyl-CoA hydratase-related protein, partial [Candidatus Dormibacteraeota bacterium]
GANLKGVGDLVRHPYTDRGSPMGYARLDPGKPTIAAVNGYCFAGGMELAAWCDFRIAAEHAEFGALNRRWGIPFTDGGTQRFSRIVGQGNALWLMETGIRIDVHRALAIGFVQEVVATGRALPRALELAEHIAGYPQASIRAERRATLATFGMDLDEGLLLEAELGRPAYSDPEMWSRLERFAAGQRPASPTLERP